MLCKGISNKLEKNKRKQGQYFIHKIRICLRQKESCMCNIYSKLIQVYVWQITQITASILCSSNSGNNAFTKQISSHFSKDGAQTEATVTIRGPPFFTLTSPLPLLVSLLHRLRVKRKKKKTYQSHLSALSLFIQRYWLVIDPGTVCTFPTWSCHWRILCRSLRFNVPYTEPWICHVDLIWF